MDENVVPELVVREWVDSAEQPIMVDVPIELPGIPNRKDPDGPVMPRRRYLRTYLYGGKPCWVAQDIGAILGYGHPRHFVGAIRAVWNDEIKVVEDFIVLGRDELFALKGRVAFAILKEPSGPRQPGSEEPSGPRQPGSGEDTIQPEISELGKQATSVMLLYGSGLFKSLNRTRKRCRHDLRTVLSKVVIPALVHARILPVAMVPTVLPKFLSRRARPVEASEPAVPALTPPADAAPVPVARPGQSKELELSDLSTVIRSLDQDVRQVVVRRLLVQHDRRDRILQASILRNTVKDLQELGLVTPFVAAQHLVLAAERAMGETFPELHVERILNPTGDYFSPSELAIKAGESVQRVGHAITELFGEVRKYVPGEAEPYQAPTEHDPTKFVTVWRYGPTYSDRILGWLFTHPSQEKRARQQAVPPPVETKSDALTGVA